MNIYAVLLIGYCAMTFCVLVGGLFAAHGAYELRRYEWDFIMRVPQRSR